MTGYVLSVDSEFDLDDIWEYIASDNIDAADRWIAKLFDAFEALARTPGLGHKREDLTDYPVLFWPVGSYLIIYPAASGLLKLWPSPRVRAIFPPSCAAVCTEASNGSTARRGMSVTDP